MTESFIYQRLTADGQSDIAKYPGGVGHFTAHGTYGSGTLKLQYRIDDAGSWVDVPDASFTASNGKQMTLPPCQIRVDLSSSTSPNILVEARKDYTSG